MNTDALTSSRNAVNKNLIIQDVVVDFLVKPDRVRAVDHVSVVFEHGKKNGLIGETGCGKSVLGHAILGLLPPYARVAGTIEYQTCNLVQLSPRLFRHIRGREIGLIPQNPTESLNPVVKVGNQIMEALLPARLQAARKKASSLSLLKRFGFEDPQRIGRTYPFELSGGMQQRIVSAVGIACSPSWVIADEPTKGLDSDLKVQTSNLLKDIFQDGRRGMLIITHDLELAQSLCDTVSVMYGGEIIEKGNQVITHPLHPYTEGLIASLPKNGMKPIPGIAPSFRRSVTRCKFAPRCPRRMKRCDTEKPSLYSIDNHLVRCFLYA